jgi:putative spermidine/putrescine transport system ATP-binding protein
MTPGEPIALDTTAERASWFQIAPLVVVLAASAREIFTAPRNAYVARFMGGQNVLTGTVESVVDGHAIMAGDDGARLSIAVDKERPVMGSRLVGSICRDRVSVRKAEGGATPPNEANALLGEVHAIEYQGSYVKVTIERPAGGEVVANVVDENFFRDALDIGDRVLARWSARDVLILEGTHDGGEASMSEAAGALL